ncbi:MAG: GAF domain-containing sensor histidine kinase [Deltaproteobacteria bacterium]|nr:GAF domain-containing sensor histidine kinase [Deltaproteobacteria bacterium]
MVKRDYAEWKTFVSLWERSNLIRSFVWSQESADEASLFAQFLIRVQRFFEVDSCFIALHLEGGKVVKAAVPDGLLDQLPVDFVNRSLDLVANSRIPIIWNELHDTPEFHTVVVSPLSPAVGQPMGFLMLGHSRPRHFTKAELFVLQALAGEVSWAVRELRSKHRYRKLLSAASVELKDSLNTVLGECSHLRELEGYVLMPNHDRKLASIEKNAHETLRTTRSFLDATLIDNGQFNLPREHIDLVEVVNETLLSCRGKAKDAGLELETQYGGELPREYWTDPARFRQVLRNLANHAIEVSERGPVLIHVRQNSDFVEFTVKVAESRAVDFESEPSGDEASCGHLSGDFIHDRLGTLRENVELLNGHLHIVKRPGDGIEFGMCLPQA